jgi:alkanesulfonate monooxygenase
MHIISGDDDADQARDGDFFDKAAQYRRSDEFLDTVKLEWSSAERFDYQGEFYWSASRTQPWPASAVDVLAHGHCDSPGDRGDCLEVNAERRPRPVEFVRA